MLSRNQEVIVCAKQAVLKSPVREFRTPGFVRGQSGNWLFYLNIDFHRFSKVRCVDKE